MVGGFYGFRVCEISVFFALNLCVCKMLRTINV